MPMFIRHGQFEVTETGFRWLYGTEEVRIDAWAHDAVRVQARPGRLSATPPYALEPSSAVPTRARILDTGAYLEHGACWVRMTETGILSFGIVGDTEPRLQEVESPRAFDDPGRFFRSLSSDEFRVEVRFRAHERERFYGLGQHQHGLFDQKGAVIALEQKNTEVAVPFLYSTRGYGFLWNNPAQGQVELGRTRTRWIANRADGIDYVVVMGRNPEAIITTYADITGHVPMMPDYAAGFWQSKLRYETQQEFLEIAREYKRRGLPLSVLVIDFFHWTRMGDWKFDPVAWPDPQAMVDELQELGVEVMVSVWPTVSGDSEHFAALASNGYLVQTERGTNALHLFSDTDTNGTRYLHYYDPTTQGARDVIWRIIKKNYLDRGIRTFWLDACEPEVHPLDLDNMRLAAGNMEKVGCIYPMMHQKAFFDGMVAAGIDDVLNLTRSAWAGSQRYGAALWSGDIDSTFEALRLQVVAGLHAAMSGIPWWTTDIGGFYGGQVKDPLFRELIVRWFQYAVFCPIFRLHGFRDSWDYKRGGANEVWSFGEQAYAIIRELLFLRERLRPYIIDQMKIAHERGIPPMRPLFFDFPTDTATYEIADQFLFGPDVLVAPVLEYGAVSRSVYLPREADWENAWTGETIAGGRRLEVTAPIASLPVFQRVGAGLPFVQ